MPVTQTPMRTETREQRMLIYEALDLYADNNDLDDDTWAALLACDPVVVIRRLLVEVTAYRSAYAEEQESGTEKEKVADAARREAQKARVDYARLKEELTWLIGQRDKIRDIRWLLKEVGRHGKECDLADACHGHRDMTALIRAAANYLGE